MAKNTDLFVEQREEGDYAVRRANSQRASATAKTQAKAIAKAHKIDPYAKVMVDVFVIANTAQINGELSRRGDVPHNRRERVGDVLRASRYRYSLAIIVQPQQTAGVAGSCGRTAPG